MAFFAEICTELSMFQLRFHHNRVYRYGYYLSRNVVSMFNSIRLIIFDDLFKIKIPANNNIIPPIILATMTMIFIDSEIKPIPLSTTSVTKFVPFI